MQSKTRPSGIICPLAIPLDDDENLDVPGLKRLIDRVLPYLDGVFILGSTGEFAHLREEVADQFVDTALEYVADRAITFVGISDTGTQRAINNLKRVKRNPVDYAVVTSSYYYTFNNQQSLIEHFRRIADISPIPIIIYNIPQNTGMNLIPASVGKLSEHQNIAGIKDSWGDLFQFQELLTYKSERFVVMQGREQLAAISLWLGADGIVSALNNFAPHMLQKVLKAVKENNREESIRAQQAVTRLAQVFDQENWLSGLKATLYELGIGNGRPAKPVPSCTLEQINTIRKLLQEAEIRL